MQQDVIDSAVADLLDRGGATRAQLLRAAQRAGRPPNWLLSAHCMRSAHERVQDRGRPSPRDLRLG